ncbi:MAG: hypothetical protein LBC20_13915 [Planctomycetaceae bacterium]|jgi:hypothetical protein|nr:hypothetical protein [Planctomycetaceae bacterium]
MLLFDNEFSVGGVRQEIYSFLLQRFSDAGEYVSDMQDGTIGITTNLCTKGRTNTSACVCGDAVVFISEEVEGELEELGHDSRGRIKIIGNTLHYPHSSYQYQETPNHHQPYS